ncbi:CAAX prenyl protease 2 [Tolypocladium capitatum]|uniref:intramembrane prenyl-peptidase Rce1 n=1 Tax=Tolypocladium capitatum TaxID=45235 RepID=A0A2K3Q7H4_9HYPO|nr:CAAX prenyl protease 2 [Tolypocladium capitatum]
MDSPSSFGWRQPGLGQPQAFGLLVAYCLVYVLPLYASAATRASPTRSRDAPEAIRARIRSVSLSTAACSVATLLILLRSPSTAGSTSGPASASGEPTASHQLSSSLHLMGYWPLGLLETARALLLTALLFAGPLYECLVVDGVWREWLRLEPLRHVGTDWPAWRNMVAVRPPLLRLSSPAAAPFVLPCCSSDPSPSRAPMCCVADRRRGPVTEECLFRSAAVPLLLLAGSSLTSTVFLSPLVFGLAHLHHFYEFRITHPQTPLGAAIARSVLQLSYTSIFGAYATFIFLRTGSLLAAISVHTLCNSMGLPRVWGALEPYWLSTSELSRPLSLIKWTGLYYVLLVGGSVLWWSSLYSLTQSPMALAGF